MSCTRNEIVKQAQAWIGLRESDGSHHQIIDIYNTISPLPRGYKLRYTDAWCAGTISALAVVCKATDIIPLECSCLRMIDKAKSMGIWVENDAYVPQPGDIMMYDWDDTGSGDNKKNPDHVGIVEKVSGNTITVIEGNFDNAVKRRPVLVNGKYIRGYIVPKYKHNADNADVVTKKSVEEIAKEVIDGKWGNGAVRKAKLIAAGYNSSEVQAKVNELLKAPAPKKKSIDEIAREVINGKWGNGAERRKRLTDAGYDAAAVQKRVNELL